MPTKQGAAASSLSEANARLISYAEIATMARVQRPVPTTWARRHSDFPSPVAHEGTSPLFDGRAVVDWLITTGHGNTDAPELHAELALHTLAGWRRRVPPRILLDALTSLICLHQQLDAPVSGGLGWRSLVERAESLDPDDTFLLSELRSVPDAERIGPALATLADELTEAAYAPAEAFDWVLDSRRRLGSAAHVADECAPAITHTLARLALTADLAEDAVIAVPHARSGDLLAALHAERTSEAEHLYVAADPDPTLVRLVRRRMLVRGVYEYRLDVVEGVDPDTDEWGDPHALVCALPYEAAETRTALAVLEHIQNLADLLSAGRTAVVLGPADALVHALPAHGEADRLRSWFLAEGLLKAVISLPDGVYPHRPAYRTAIWVLSRTPETDRHGLVLLSDLTAETITAATLNTVIEETHDFHAAGWRADRRHEPRRAVLVPILHLRPGAALTPQYRSYANRYTQPVYERPVRISELELTVQQFREQDRADQSAPIRTNAVLRPEGQPIRRTSVARLLKERRLRRLPGHRIAAEHLASDGHYPVITPAEVMGVAPVGGRRIDRAVLLTAYEHAEFTEPGDIVVTTSPVFGVYVDEEGLSVVAYPARVLRARHDRDPEHPVRPRVLAALLRAAAEHGRVNGAMRAPRRIEDLIVPDLDPTEAAHYDALLAEISRRTALLRQQSAALDDLARLTAAGLTDGTLALNALPN
ncbi:hypothetical protein DFR70_12858 [Nocardia tenerifensis]|uniref:N-6 DNA methylase n=1 Tax=Nocardia tenerifensis TaxID=228006 RepID=A0A318JKP7_9NOCA|nr:hypothetical protein [Nocardia tenerifensis]PXX53345.1 hypothetical protein DFR70_12858 [Nocardia tenerifensis]